MLQWREGTGREIPAFHRVVRDSSLIEAIKSQANTKLEKDYPGQRKAKCKDPRALKSSACPSHETEPRLER